MHARDADGHPHRSTIPATVAGSYPAAPIQVTHPWTGLGFVNVAVDVAGKGKTTRKTIAERERMHGKRKYKDRLLKYATLFSDTWIMVIMSFSKPKDMTTFTTDKLSYGTNG